MASIQWNDLNDFTPLAMQGPAAPYQSAAGSLDSDSSSGSKGKTQSHALQDKMIQWLYQKGLPSDVAALIEQFGVAIDNIIDPSGRPNTALYKMLLPQLSRISQEREEYQEALQVMRKNEASGDIAISARGEVYTLNNDGQLETSSYSDAKGRRLLTNGELARIRMADPTVGAFRTDINSALANSTGIKQIGEFIQKQLNDLGKTVLKSDQFADVNEDILKGAKQIIEAVQGKGAVKITTETMKSDTQIQAALNYMISNMPTNMAIVLQNRADNLKTTPSQIISNYLISKADITSKVSYDVDAPKDGKSGKSSKPNNEVKVDPFMELALSQGGHAQDISIVSGQNYGLKATLPGRTFQQLVDPSGKLVSDNTLDNILDTGIGKLTNASLGVYAGNALVPVSKFDNVYINTRNVGRVKLPCATDNYGVDHPDTEFLGEMQKFFKYYDRDKAARNENYRNQRATDLQNNRVLSQYISGLDKFGNFVYKNGNFKDFYLLNGYVALGSDDNSAIDEEYSSTFGDFATKLDDNEADLMRNVIKRNTSRDFSSDDIYRTLIYLPMEGTTKDVLSMSGQLTLDPDDDGSENPTDIRRGERVDQSSEFNGASSSALGF